MTTVRLIDLANKLNLDISTVSRALRGDSRVKSSTRDKVVSAASSWGYRPNIIAKSLAEGRNSTIWLLLPDLASSVEREPSTYASTWLMEKGYDLLIAQYHNDQQVFSRMLGRLDQGGADGAIIIPNSDHFEDSTRVWLDKLRVPFVLLDRSVPGVRAPLVTSNNEAITYQLILSLSKTAPADAPLEWLVNGFYPSRNTAEALRSAGAKRAAHTLGLKLVTIEDMGRGLIPKGHGAFVGTNQFEILAVPGTQKYCTSVAVFDNWLGSTHPFQKVLVAVQDFQSMAEHASALLMSSIEKRVKLEATESLIPEREIRIL